MVPNLNYATFSDYSGLLFPYFWKTGIFQDTWFSLRVKVSSALSFYTILNPPFKSHLNNLNKTERDANFFSRFKADQ